MKLANLFISFYHENHTADPKVKTKMDQEPVEHKKSFTTCQIMQDEQHKVQASAILHEGDNFCRETGRKISLGRALRAMNLTKSQRAEVWEAYRTSAPKPRWTRK